MRVGKTTKSFLPHNLDLSWLRSVSYALATHFPFHPFFVIDVSEAEGEEPFSWSMCQSPKRKREEECERGRLLLKVLG